MQFDRLFKLSYNYFFVLGGSQVSDRLHRGGLQEGPGRAAEGDHQSPDLHERRRPRYQETSHPGKNVKRRNCFDFKKSFSLMGRNCNQIG